MSFFDSYVFLCHLLFSLLRKRNLNIKHSVLLIRYFKMFLNIQNIRINILYKLPKITETYRYQKHIAMVFISLFKLIYSYFEIQNQL